MMSLMAELLSVASSAYVDISLNCDLDSLRRYSGQMKITKYLIPLIEADSANPSCPNFRC